VASTWFDAINFAGEEDDRRMAVLDRLHDVQQTVSALEHEIRAIQRDLRAPREQRE
jgi:hypothetical protein